MLKKILMATCVLALLLGALGLETDSASAGGFWVPVFDDTVVASVTVGDDVFVATLDLLPMLEEHTGELATIETLGDTIAAAAPASAFNQFRIYGGYASGQAQSDLEDKGYDACDVLVSDMPGVDTMAVYTD